MIDRSSWRLSIVVAVMMILSVLSRPEGAVYGVAIYGVLFAYTAYERYRGRVSTQGVLHIVGSAGMVLVLGLSYITWKLNYFGYLLPNPYYVKSAEISLEGFNDVLIFLVHLTLWLVPTDLILVVLYSCRVHWKLLVIMPDSRQWAKVLLTLGPPLIGLAYPQGFLHRYIKGGNQHCRNDCKRASTVLSRPFFCYLGEKLYPFRTGTICSQSDQLAFAQLPPLLCLR